MLTPKSCGIRARDRADDNDIHVSCELRWWIIALHFTRKGEREIK